MPSYPKIKPYRNRKHLNLARDCEYCCICGGHGHGTIVPCHSNSIQDGHGMGQKAHDIVAFGCHDCHSLVDGRSGDLTKEQRELMFYRGVYNTFLWLLREGKLVIK